MRILPPPGVIDPKARGIIPQGGKVANRHPFDHTYTYDPLTSATYSTGEQFGYGHGEVKHSTLKSPISPQYPPVSRRQWNPVG
jgi:hypothetical protein